MEKYSQYLMWMKSKHILNSHFQASMASFSNSWEEQAFAEDAAGPLGGFIWPPRSYSCSFCRREFRSAQALGGHMNVHRRDRARLKQSLSPRSELQLHHQNHNQQKSLDISSYPSQVYTLNPNFNPSFAAPSPRDSPSRASAISTQENFSDHYNTYLPASNVQEYQKGFPYSSPIPSWPESKTDLEKNSRLIKDPIMLVPDDTVETNLSVGLKYLSDGDEGVCCKRHKTTTVPTLSFFLKPCSSEKYDAFQSEVMGLRTNSMEDLDLELRLGDPAKVK